MALLLWFAAAGVLLRIGADDLGWLASYLAGLELRFSVTQPAELRTAIRSLAERLIASA
jgi:predicted DNA-binding transcriptional regulator YafY